jgi:hypothetical protein
MATYTYSIVIIRGGRGICLQRVHKEDLQQREFDLWERQQRQRARTGRIGIRSSQVISTEPKRLCQFRTRPLLLKDPRGLLQIGDKKGHGARALNALGVESCSIQG